MKTGFRNKRLHGKRLNAARLCLDFDRNAEAVVNTHFDIVDLVTLIPVCEDDQVTRARQENHFPVDLVASSRIEFVIRHGVFTDRDLEGSGTEGIIINFGGASAHDHGNKGCTRD